jgi:hypothetical protein
MRRAPEGGGDTSIRRQSRSFDGQGNMPATSMTREYLMAQHGYLREYDEGWDRGDDPERERGQRDREDRNRDRGFIFGSGDDNPFDRMGDRARERFSDDDRQWRRTHADDWRSRDRDQGYSGDDRDRSPRSFRSYQDDHYRSWRDRQMQALDRDYEDYCREREQQFHSDFDSWRRNRGQRQQQGGNSDEVLELTESRPEAMNLEPSAVADATLGTNNSENTAPGRR